MKGGWTFGIITRGTRQDNVETFIKSVRAQNIPDYEIIVVGGPEPIHDGYDTVHVPFMEQDDKGWITRKKNIIGDLASYHNILIAHDDVELKPDWYEIVKDETFDVANFVYYNEDGSRSMGEYATYDGQQYIGGSIIAFTASVFDKVQWNENLFFAEEEDVKYSLALKAAGISWIISKAGFRQIGQIHNFI